MYSVVDFSGWVSPSALKTARGVERPWDGPVTQLAWFGGRPLRWTTSWTSCPRVAVPQAAKAGFLTLGLKDHLGLGGWGSGGLNSIHVLRHLQIWRATL